uniref:Uncharacterized protein n=1 Tax=Zea mays TaxID=4577 RepID=A0A804R7W9_MAIZE
YTSRLALEPSRARRRHPQATATGHTTPPLGLGVRLHARFLPQAIHPIRSDPSVHHVGDVDAAGLGRGGRGQGRRGDPGAGRGHAGLAGGVAVPDRAAAAAGAPGVRHRGGPARDGAQAQAPRRPPPRLLRERRAPGPGQVRRRLLPRIHRLPRGQRPRLPGSCGGAGRVHGGFRPRRVRAERPQPQPVRQERGAGRGGARGRAGARPQVLRHRHLPRLPCRLGRPQIHPRQDRRRGDDGAGGELLVARVLAGAGGGGVREAGGGRPVGAARVAPRAGHPPLVDGAELAAHLHGGGRHHAAAQRARRRDPEQDEGGRHVPAEAGAGDAAGDPRVLLPRHDRHVRQVGVRPHGAAGAAVPRAPLAGRRGRPRPCRAAEVPRRQDRMDQLP